MNTLILLTALSGWSYEGFCSDPEPPAPAVVVPDVPGAPPGIVPVTPFAPGLRVERPAEPPAAVERSRVQPPAVQSPTLPPPPTRWQIADASGQVWEHTDPEWLRRWVGSRNQSLRAAPAPAAVRTLPAYPAASPCAGGRCYRGR